MFQTPQIPFRLFPCVVAESQHSLDQIFRKVFVEHIVAAADGGVDAEIGEEVFGDLGDFGEDEFNLDLIRKLSGPHFGDEILAAVAGGLPKAEEAADFVVMQQTVVTRFDLRRPRLVGTKQVLLNAVEIRRAAAFEDESVVRHSGLCGSGSDEICLN